MFKIPLLQMTCRIAQLALLTMILLASTLVNAQGTDHQDQGVWGKTKTTVLNITDQGKWDLYLSGYAHHFDRSDTNNLNEKAWGAGFGKTFRNSKGNDESLFVLINKDSHRDMEYIAGYMHQWIYPAGSSGLELGAGLAAFIISREDCFHGTPFPFILPIASIGTKKAKLMATVAPYNQGHGSRSAVVLIFGKLGFD